VPSSLRSRNHADERTHKTLNNVTVAAGPDPGTVYINIGDGGNREGQYDYWFPGLEGADAPVWSAFRQPQFGHGKLEIMNATHSLWTWHRTEFGEKVVSDNAWIVRADTPAAAAAAAAAASAGSADGSLPMARGLVGGHVGGQAGMVERESNFERGQDLVQGMPIAKGLRSE
jgi:hypothetical protein